MLNSNRPLELWGGAECTVNRVHDSFMDQHGLSGHRERLERDLECIAALGMKTLRAGLPWEHYAGTRSWETADRMLGTMRELSLRPIVGLLHHGSGPADTDLLDPDFPARLAAYALAVAQRYPWVTSYTPVNEPHTTSRFSCLYGHWYPHHRSMASYLRAFLHEMKAIVLAMEAIRTVQRRAKLVHTEDGGRTFAPPELESIRAQREQRQWLGTDLLCGMVDRHHPLFPFLLEHGLGEREILWFAEHRCPPAVIGLNYYVTSDRYLDSRTELYAPFMRGGDTGSEPLVDIEAIRVRPEGIAGACAVLTEAWQRYRLPVAITEAHLGDRSDQQIRWLREIWDGALQAQRNGADVRAVTVWALFGSWNWCNLCTEDKGIYEPGAFDVRSGTPEVTALGQFVQTLAGGDPPFHPALAGNGWWSLPDRLAY